ncbi:MAG TPA: BON domain-containing protein [Gemmatimonadales bacterium]
MLSNVEMQKKVLEALDFEPSLDATHIGVATNDGIVTLTGQVPSYADKVAAERAVKRIFGVKGIAINLEVRLAGDARRSDSDLAAAAVRALEWDVQVPHQRIQVRVADGWVTLEGSADWNYQRESAYRAVRNLTGVRGVSNLIALTKKVMPGDVQSRIEKALKRTAELEARGIQVQTTGGKVVLEGKVHSWAEREEAENASWSAPGVTEVVDHLVVTA